MSSKKRNLYTCLNYEKKFTFQPLRQSKIPTKVFNSDKWSIEHLQNIKSELNKTKSLLDVYELEKWSNFTKSVDLSVHIPKILKERLNIELSTRAWCKFYECIHQFNLIPDHVLGLNKLKSLHLCEAPGGFIAALNHYLASYYPDVQLEWLANTLNPNYEGNSLVALIADDRLIKYTHENWLMGADLTGDITKYHNFLDFKTNVKHKFDIITADGSIDCTVNFAEQEKLVGFLHYCQTMCALQMLEKGGNYVLKIFTTFEDNIVCLLYLLTLTFNQVNLFKPASSKNGNSEVYVICKNFNGINILDNIWEDLLTPYKNGHFDDGISMFSLECIENNFIRDIFKSAEFFMKKQTEQILTNIDRFSKTRDDDSTLRRRKWKCGLHFIHKYEINRIPKERRIVPTLSVKLNFLKLLDFENVLYFRTYQLYQCENIDDLIDIKLGRKIEFVKSSNYCLEENLEKFQLYCKHKKAQTSLHKLLVQKCDDVFILNMFDCCFNNYDEYKNYILSSLKYCQKDTILLINIPLITNFLVGLVLILIVSYKITYINKMGCFVLQGKMYKINKILEKIDELEKNIDQQPFTKAIVQIINPSCLMRQYSLRNFIFTYNEMIFSNGFSLK